MYINTSKLIPTHNSLRNPELVTKFLSNLDSLDEALESEDDRISVAEMEGDLYVFNSHHRMVAVDIAYGKIKESALNIKSYTVDEMLIANPEIGWVTPFDPHFYCRVPDFLALKNSIIKVYDRIKSNGETYWWPYVNWINSKIIEPRKVHTLGELYSDI